MRKLILLVIVLVSVGAGALGYYLINQRTIYITGNQPKRPINEIKMDVYKGNVEAYGELRTIYLDYPQEDFLFWALYTANRYHDKDAYSDVYRIMEAAYNSDPDSFSLKDMDSVSRKMVLRYLDLAAKNGDATADSLMKIVH